MQQALSSNCKVCGLRLSNDAMLTHELNCLQLSQEQVDTELNPKGNDNHANENRDLRSGIQQPALQDDITNPYNNNNPTNLNPVWPLKNQEPRLPDHISSPEDEELVRNTDTSRPSSSSSIQISEIDEDDDQESDDSMDYLSSSAISTQSDEAPETDNTVGNPSSSKGKKKKKKKRLVTSTFRYDRKKPKNLFPPTKKYRYYPVTCDFCRQRFQPNELKAHQEKHHFKEPGSGKFRRRAQSTATRKGFVSKEPAATRAKSVSGMMSRFQFCYICGQMYGSKSIKIHEPQCLKKWRIENEKLPPRSRAPEPVKPEPVMPVAENKEYPVPEYDPAVEAAFESHLANLIPCDHCSRTFSPDRIQRHMSCCIERPKSRQCVTPKGGEIPR